MAIKDGKILAVGAMADIKKLYHGTATKYVDLKGRTILPSFIDAHSHYISSLSIANQVNVYPPPSGPGKDVASIVSELVKFRDAKKIPKGELIQAYGYDDSVMPDGRKLRKEDIDN